MPGGSPSLNDVANDDLANEDPGTYVEKPAILNPDSALGMLDEAHAIAQDFQLQQRGIVVLRAAEVVSPIEPKRGREWALEVWQIAKHLPLKQNRIALEKNALRNLAVNDPELALKMAREEDLPASWDAVHKSTEDSRSMGYGNMLFKHVWERAGRERYLASLESLADYFGATGQYPYAAMAKIANDIAAKHSGHANQILKSATHYFHEDPGFLTTDEEFVDFILSTRKVATSRNLQKELDAAVVSLTRPPVQFPNQKWQVSATTPLGNATFQTHNEALLFRLLPLVRTLRPVAARDLLSRYSSLRDAPVIEADTPVTLAGFLSIKGTADDATVKEQQDESRLLQVEQIASSNPRQALSVAIQISTPDLQRLALLYLAPMFSKVDEAKAMKWVSDAESAIPTQTDDEKKLRLIVGVIRTKHEMKRAMNDGFIRFAFDVGEQLFTTYLGAHPATLDYQVSGYEELLELADLAVSEGGAVAVFKINTVQNPLLRANLLIAGAKGMLRSP